MPVSRNLTPRIAAELIHHEGIVREAYRDSKGVWTWGVGITNASGHAVARYRDKPQKIARCLEVYIWALRTRYLPAVERAFAGTALAEHELGAALSFHYNTGAIERADWVALFCQGKRDTARKAMMNWCHPASLATRRRREQALFFDRAWTTDGTALVYDVAKPSYAPRGGKRVNVMPALEQLLA